MPVDKYLPTFVGTCALLPQRQRLRMFTSATPIAIDQLTWRYILGDFLSPLV